MVLYQSTRSHSFLELNLKAPGLDAGPRNDTSRLMMLDAVRGFAVLGILVMNIQSFAMISAAYLNPCATPELTEQLTGSNYAVWYVGHVFFDTKFMTLFSLLFGAGVLLMAERCEATGRASGWRPAVVHYRRLMGLLLIGMVHGYVFWSGDILVPYAICGAVVYPFWRCRNRIRLVVATGLFLMGSLIMVATGLSIPFWPESERDAMQAEMWQPTPEIVSAEISAYTGPWWEQLVDRAGVTLELQTYAMGFQIFWQVSALMLIGMTLLKTDVLTGQAYRRVYVAMVLAGLAVGLPMIVGGTWLNEQRNWEMDYSFFVGTQPNYFGGLLLALGYIGVWGLILKQPVGQRLAGCFAPVGRMALTNYLMQTLICTTIFYGHGFGLFMTVSRVGQAMIVVAIWVFQIVASHWWMKRFRYGPAEYLWRTITYAKLPSPPQSSIKIS
ncbi:MAG: DUF418 domain-containing protein [Pirellulaceae bacterium]